LGTLGAAAGEGRTVLFVSHQMNAITTLCNQTLLLKDGQIDIYGLTVNAITQYLTSSVITIGYWKREQEVPDIDGIYFEEISIINSNNIITGHIAAKEKFTVTINLKVIGYHQRSEVNIRFTNHSGIPIFSTGHQDARGEYLTMIPGRYRYQVDVPANLLNPGQYTLLVGALRPGVKIFDIVDNNLALVIEDIGSLTSMMNDGRKGVISICLKWNEIPLLN
jgi:lipopolysaccharide transport system ATP-binding protein